MPHGLGRPAKLGDLAGCCQGGTAIYVVLVNMS